MGESSAARTSSRAQRGFDRHETARARCKLVCGVSYAPSIYMQMSNVCTVHMLDRIKRQDGFLWARLNEEQIIKYRLSGLLERQTGIDVFLILNLLFGVMHLTILHF